MRRIALAFAALILIAAPIHGQGGGDLESDAQRLGYSVGYQVGEDFHDAHLALDVDLLIDGLRGALEGAKPRLSPEEMRESLRWLAKTTEAAASADPDSTEAAGGQK